MADAGFFKGTSADQDRRFSDKELKLLKSMKFPSNFDQKVDIRKVNLQVIRPWIAKKVIELLGFEDEVVVEYAMGLLEDASQPTPDPKKMQINLTGFLTSSTPAFMGALWTLLIEAQASPAGIPRTFVEEKKEEMRKAREGDSRAFDERDRRTRLDEIRDRERDGRGGRGRGRGRGRGKGGYDDARGGRGRDSGWGPRTGGRPRPPSRSPRRRRSPNRGSPFSTRSSRSRSFSPSRRFRSPRQSPARSGSGTPNRRRPRSPSPTPPPRDRRGGGKERRRDSRSPPPRRRRYSPDTRSMSRTRSPPYRGYARRRSTSRSPPRRRLRRSPTRSISPPRRRVRTKSPSPDRQHSHKESKRTPSWSSRSRSPVNKRNERGGDRMDVDSGELKIKGQAEAERRKSKWDKEGQNNVMNQTTELEKRENELKEKALRNKVVKTRKSSVGGNP